MDPSSSLLIREESVCSLFPFECSWLHTLVSIMGVLTLTLGLMLIVYSSSQKVAFSVGICMTVASVVFVALSRVQASSNENLTEVPVARSRSETSLSTSQTSVASSTTRV